MERTKKILIKNKNSPLFVIDSTPDNTESEWMQSVEQAVLEYYSKLHDEINIEFKLEKPSRIKVIYKDSTSSGFYMLDWTFIPYFT